jgi:cation diffusion facilitator family transporter
LLILLAAGSIGWFAIGRLIDPQPVEAVGLGVAVSLVATVVNLAVARILLRVAAARDSIVLKADGQHLMADVFTSIGVIAGLILVRVTGIDRLDPIIALIVAVNIVWTGIGLIRTSIDGLLDRALAEADQERIRAVIQSQLEPGETFHALRTRKAGARRFVDFHLLVPGKFSVQDAHDVTERVERAVKAAFPGTEVTVHIEPIEEPAAWDDSALVPLEPHEPHEPPPTHHELRELHLRWRSH